MKTKEEDRGEEDEEAINYVFKIVVVGDSAVGKTQLLGLFTKEEFHFDSKSTISVEFQIRTLSLNRKRIEAQIWDTAGQESDLCSYRAITNAYYRGAVGATLVYDSTRRYTFHHIEKWMNSVPKPITPSSSCSLEISLVLLGRGRSRPMMQ